MSNAFDNALMHKFTQAVPHAQEMGLEVISIARESIELRLPYRENWLGDTDNRIIHTGVLTALADSACGMAVLSRLERFQPIATVDLRMDYLRPAVADQPIHCRAECYRMTTYISFARALLWQNDAAKPVAQTQAVFMMGAKRPKPSA